MHWARRSPAPSLQTWRQLNRLIDDCNTHRSTGSVRPAAPLHAGPATQPAPVSSSSQPVCANIGCNLPAYPGFEYCSQQCIPGGPSHKGNKKQLPPPPYQPSQSHSSQPSQSSQPQPNYDHLAHVKQAPTLTQAPPQGRPVSPNPAVGVSPAALVCLNSGCQREVYPGSDFCGRGCCPGGQRFKALKTPTEPGYRLPKK